MLHYAHVCICSNKCLLSIRGTLHWSSHHVPVRRALESISEEPTLAFALVGSVSIKATRCGITLVECAVGAFVEVTACYS
jgi:hypothetical protein